VKTKKTHRKGCWALIPSEGTWGSKGPKACEGEVTTGSLKRAAWGGTQNTNNTQPARFGSRKNRVHNVLGKTVRQLIVFDISR